MLNRGNWTRPVHHCTVAVGWPRSKSDPSMISNGAIGKLHTKMRALWKEAAGGRSMKSPFAEERARTFDAIAKDLAKKFADLFDDTNPPGKVRTLEDMSEEEIRELEKLYSSTVIRPKKKKEEGNNGN